MHGSENELRNEVKKHARIGANIDQATKSLRAQGWDVVDPHFPTEPKNYQIAAVRIGSLFDFRSTFRESTGIDIDTGPSPYVIIKATPSGKIYYVE